MDILPAQSGVLVVNRVAIPIKQDFKLSFSWCSPLFLSKFNEYLYLSEQIHRNKKSAGKFPPDFLLINF